MNWIKMIKILIFLMFAPAVINDTDRCEPFKALFIWHTSSESRNNISYVQGLRLLIHFIHGLAEGTDVILMTIGAEANIDTQFQKKATNFSWRDDTILKHKPGNNRNHVIPSNEISEAVFKYLDQNNTPKRAEEVFLIVTNKSVIDNEVRVKEALGKKKTFVVVYGEQTDLDIWTYLATDNSHLKILQKSEDSLNNTLKTLRSLSCKDASLLCDTDQYWTGDRCYRCSYICSSSPSEYCLKDCHYSNHSVQDTDPVVKTSVNDQNEDIKTWLIINTVLIPVLVSIVVMLLFFWHGREFKKQQNLCLRRKSEEIQTILARLSELRKENSQEEVHEPNGTGVIPLDQEVNQDVNPDIPPPNVMYGFNSAETSLFIRTP